MFKAPRALRNGTTLTFELTLTDANGKQSSDTCVVQVTDTGAIGQGTGGSHHVEHTIDDGHIHNRVSMMGHFTGDGHNHTVGQGHTGHKHGKVVRGRAAFTARGTVVTAPTIENPDRMTIKIQSASRSLKEHPAGSEVEFIISPYAFVNIYRVGPSTLDEVLRGTDVTVRGNVVESLDGTSVLYENKTIMVR
jgi:hypothetical protein